MDAIKKQPIETNWNIMHILIAKYLKEEYLVLSTSEMKTQMLEKNCMFWATWSIVLSRAVSGV